MTRPGRKTAGPVLADVDPERVAQAAADILTRRVEHLAWQCQPALRLVEDAPREWGATQIGPTLYDLAEYARDGGDHALAYEALITVSEVLLSRPIDERSYPDLTAADLQTELGLVLVAARARWQLSQRASVDAVGLAALAGLSPRSVQRLAAAGELVPESDGRPARYDAAQCVRWLGARGVPGFAS